MSRKREEYAPRGTEPRRDVESTCAWDDHGTRCTRYGTHSDATNGAGPWWCRVHYRQLNGWPARPEPETPEERHARRMARFEGSAA